MKRRTFLQTTLVGGLASRLPSTAEASTGVRGRDPGTAQAFELEEATVSSLTEGMRSGRWTAQRITELYLERIEAIDRRGPTLKAVIETNPDAPAIAAERDRERRDGRIRGPLHGIPILIKDNIDSGDRMQTTAGSLALEGSPAPRDAFIVARLREAGAVLLGKANLSEWANFRGQRSSSGWSGRGGQVRNPNVLDRSPCGSSSGSGSAASANLATLTIGTETDGSIVCPASANGIVGVKPTVGLWSRSGIIPISATQDTAGPMCRTVTDAALLLGALAGIDPDDPATAASRGHSTGDYASGLTRDALRGARLGVYREGLGLGPKVDPVLANAVDALKEAGAVLVDPANLPPIDRYSGDELELFFFELKDGLNKYLASRGSTARAKTIEDLIRFNEEHRERELRFFGQEHFLEAAKRGGLADPKYRAARQRLRSVVRGNLRGMLARHRLDAVVCITGGPAWPIDLVNGDRFTGGDSSYAAIAGFPHVTVPAGRVDGLPIGFSFFGDAWTEARLLGFAYAFEQTTKARIAPAFRPTVDDRT
ncbi:MAG: amidase [Gemmatimonadales bacterium]